MCLHVFSFLFCGEENRIIYEGKFKHFGVTLRCIKQLGLSSKTQQYSPVFLAKIWLAWELASTSFGMAKKVWKGQTQMENRKEGDWNEEE